MTKFVQYIELALKDKTFEVGVRNATSEVQKLQREARGIKSPVDDGTKAFESMRGGIANVARAAFSLKGAIVGALAGFSVKQVVDAAAQQETAVNSVATAMKRARTFSRSALADMESFAAQLQDVTGIGDETSLKMVSLAMAFGASGDQAKLMTQAAIELAAATGKSADEAIAQVSKTLGGFAGELGEVNPAIKALTVEQLKNGEAARILIAQYGGTAQASLNTYAGAVAATKNRFSGLLEEIGFLITKNPAVIEAIKLTGEAFASLGKLIHENAAEITKFTAEGLRAIIKEVPNTIRALGAMAETMAILAEVTPLAPLVKLFGQISNPGLGVVRSLALEFAEVAQAVIKVFQVMTFIPRKLGGLAGIDLGITKKFEDADKALDQLKNRLTFDQKPVKGFDALKAALKGTTEEAKSTTDQIDKLLNNLNKVGSTPATRGTAGVVPVAVGQPSSAPSAPVFGPVPPPSTEPTQFGGLSWLPPTMPVTFGPVEPEPGAFDAVFNQISTEMKTEVLPKFKAIGPQLDVSLLQGLKNGKDGAKQFISTASAAIADVFVPGLGAAVGPIVDLLALGPEQAKAQIEAFIDGIPEIINGLVDAIPVVAEALAGKVDVIIEAFVAASPRIATAFFTAMYKVSVKLAEEIVAALTFHLGRVGEVFTKWGTEIGKAIGDFPAKIAQGATDFINKLLEKVGDVAKKLDPSKAVKGVAKKNGRSTEGIVADTIFPGVGAAYDYAKGLATGGMVRGSGNRDTVPAMLSPGELVVDRTTGPRLNAFMDEYSRGPHRQADNTTVEILLARVLELLGQPVTVDTAVTIDGRRLGDAILTLTRQNARLGV